MEEIIIQVKIFVDGEEYSESIDVPKNRLKSDEVILHLFHKVRDRIKEVNNESSEI